jgi:cytochrome c551/cytochrome c550
MKNAAMPYAIIAVLGIVAVVIVSAIGLNQQVDVAEDGEDTEQVEEGNGSAEGEDGAAEGETASGGEDVYQNNCAACHGADLSGGAGPALTDAGSNFSQDELADIIQNGTGSMPAQNVAGEELDALTTWLMEQ